MDSVELKSRVNKIKMWQRGGERAPHKPLLILYALGRLTRNEPRLMSYEDVKEDLKNLLLEFGPQRASYSPEYPFVRLTNDGIWNISGLNELHTKKDWSERELINNQTLGGFSKPIYDLLIGNTTLIHEITSIILNQNFPDTFHQDILHQIGLNLESTEVKTALNQRPSRSPDFRIRVLKAYDYKCAVCDFNVRLGNTLVAVEAAHIKWHQAGGPDQEQNGIALCSLHHKLFDRGVFSLTADMIFQVAENAHGTHGMDEWLMRFHGKVIRKPQRPEYYPEDSNLVWHIKEVFRGPARCEVSSLFDDI